MEEGSKREKKEKGRGRARSPSAPREEGRWKREAKEKR
jgi:hypothetical protein